MAESRHIHWIERLIEPVRNIFSAIFFAAIGLLFDPRVPNTYARPIALITVVVVGKLFACGSAAYIAGNGDRTSMRVGMGLPQIGEFSFIIAALGQSLKVTGEFLYPIAVAVSAVTSLLTTYLIKWADPLTLNITRHLPPRVLELSQLYASLLQNIRPQGDRARQAAILRRITLQVVINLALVTAVFMACRFCTPFIVDGLSSLGITVRYGALIAWAAAILLSLPCLLAAYGKLKVLSLVLAESSVFPTFSQRYTSQARRLVAELISMSTLIGFLFLIVMLSASILPPFEQLLLTLAIVIVFG